MEIQVLGNIIPVVVFFKMICQAKISDNRNLDERQCKREASMGIFCVYHNNYIAKLKKKINDLKEELERIKNKERELE